MKIIRDTARKLDIHPLDIFVRAIKSNNRREDPNVLWKYYIQTNTIPEFVVDFCLDVLQPRKDAAA